MTSKHKHIFPLYVYTLLLLENWISYSNMWIGQKPPWQKHIWKDPFFDKWIDINCWIIYIFAFICFHPLMSWSTGHLIRQLWLIFFHPENLTKMSFQINLIEVLCRYFAQICLIEFFLSVEIYNQDNYVFCVNYCACPLTRLL